MPEIFINYRTGDGNETAAHLDRGLSDRFGPDAVFFAGRSIKPGQEFPPALLSHVRRSSVVLAVMGREWGAHPGLRAEGDWVRKELLEARACGIRVVPVLTGRRIERLRADQLPAELAYLAEVQSLRFESPNHVTDLVRIGDEVVDLVPRLAELEEANRQGREAGVPGAVGNSVVGGISGGTVVQARDVGDVGTVIKGNTGPIHTGSGSQHNHTPHLSGDGAAYIAGDNHGGIANRFTRARGDEAAGR